MLRRRLEIPQDDLLRGALLLALVTAAAPVYAQGVQLPPITVGGGLQTSFVHTDADADADVDDEDDSNDAFLA